MIKKLVFYKFNSTCYIFNCCLKLIAKDVNYYKGDPDNSQGRFSPVTKRRLPINEEAE